MKPNLYCPKHLILLLINLFCLAALFATVFDTYDEAIVLWANGLRSDLGDKIWLSITSTAGPLSYGVVCIVFILSFFSKVKQLRYKYYAMVVAGLLSGLLVVVTKVLIGRVRPYYLNPEIHALGYGGGYSFPSGHTSDAFFLAAILLLTFPKQKVLIGVTYCWALMVGISRVYLGVHYPSDVIAGIAISSLAAVFAVMMISRFFGEDETGFFQGSPAPKEDIAKEN